MEGLGKNTLDDIQRKYHNCELQLTELDCFIEELVLLRNLSNTYFLDFLKDEHQGQIHILVNRLDILEAQSLNFMDTIKLRMHHLTMAKLGKTTHKVTDSNQEKNVLQQSELDEFYEDIKHLKKEMFYIVERFMSSGKLNLARF